MKKLEFNKIRNTNDLNYLKKVITNDLIPNLRYHIEKRQKENNMFIKSRNQNLQHNLNNYKYNRNISDSEERRFKELYFSKEFENNVDFLLEELQKNIEFQTTQRRRKTRVQSILFHVNFFKTKEQCIAWIKRQNKERKGRDYDFVYSKYDPPSGPRESYHRFRQFPPNKNKEHRISKGWEIDNGVKFIYEY
jgi:DNA polymerase III alpha subunit (gram-positive type)